MGSAARFLAIATAATLVAAAPSSFTRDELDALLEEKSKAEAQLEALESAAAESSGDLTRIEGQLIAAAMESRRREEQATAAEARLIDLRARQASARRELNKDTDTLEDLLAALAFVGRSKPPALVTAPQDSNRSIRAAIMMADAAPKLSARADDLAIEIDTLNGVERDIRIERARLEAAEATLALKRAEIERFAAAKRARHEQVAGDAAALKRRVARLASQAGTLQDLLAALEAAAPEPPRAKPKLQQFASLSPALPPSAPPTRPAAFAPPSPGEIARFRRPAAGLVAKAFGDPAPGDLTHQGLTIETRLGAQVVAPADGVIEYAASYRSYGLVLILRTTDGYRVVLSGLDVVYGVENQQVSVGEPVGRMADRAQDAPKLYIELVEKGGRRLDPAKWMRTAT